MRLTTLGTGTVSLVGDRACAGHHVAVGSASVLLDCGSGIGARLAAARIEWMAITHVALTHFHTDHVGDLPLLFQAWKHGRIPTRAAPLTVVGPPGTAALLARLAVAFGEWMRTPGFPLTVVEMQPHVPLDLGDGASLSCFPVPHTPESVAYSIARGTARVVYTGDTGESAALAAWAHGASVLLAECSLSEALAIPGHLTPARCARLAAAAAPERLVLTHFYPPAFDEDIAAVVAERYDGPVVLAHDGWYIDIEDD